MKIFISYSTDLALVEKLAQQIRPQAHVWYWAEGKEPGKEVWATIEREIGQANLVVPVITDQAVRRAMSIGTEVGIARRLGKKIVPLVGPNVPSDALGCLNGTTYIQLDPAAPQKAFAELEEVVLSEKAESKRKAKEQEEATKGFLILAGVVLMLFAVSE